MMRQSLRYFLLLVLSIGLMPKAADAQFFEDTWQEFLKNSKASNISQLVMPNKKDAPTDYAKYCLMYATTHFCADEIKDAEAQMLEIRGMGETVYGGIAGFKDRYDDLQIKIKAYHAIEGLWTKFLDQRNVTVEEIDAVDRAKKVCEKGTLAKVFYMEAHANYCKGDIAKCRDLFNNRVLQLAEKTSFDISHLRGLPEEVKMMKELFAGLDKLEPAWKKLMETNVSPGFDTELPLMKCYPEPSIKEYILKAAVDVCKYGSEMLKKIKALQANNPHALSSDVREKIEWIEGMVGTAEADVSKLNAAWKEFMSKGKYAGELQFDFPCNRDAQLKAYIIDGMSNICEKGQARLDDIAKLRKEHNPKMDEETANKLKEYEAKVKKMSGDLAALEKAWAEFVPNDTITSGAKFGYDYPCDKGAQIKAYIMTGLMETCTKGREMLDKAEKTQAEFNPELEQVVLDKLAKLKAKVEVNEKDLADLNAAWKMFTPQDTIIGEYRLVDYYCDKIAQIKSWTIKGHFSPCDQGQGYINKIDALQKKHSLTYDAELACRVTRLRIKVWDCRWWELVRQARKETHEERERFGPASAAIMKQDIHNDQCPPDVIYNPLGYIGIKYIIVNYLCQKEDGGKIGSADYYKKIASWVDNQVLVKYCQPNMRCKEEFFIYLEGHTDGNAFSGRTYQESLNIPMGTEFTHYIGKDTTHKKVDRQITTSLKNNMELGLARAWLMKRELLTMNAFAGVPITIGAYEHPATEKGGTYRRIEIELNMTNLLLDYYEKRLKELHVASGIGERPKECK